MSEKSTEQLLKETIFYIMSIALILGVFGWSFYTTYNNPIKYLDFKVFDVIEYDDITRRILPYGHKSFTLIGELNIEILIDCEYHLIYRELRHNVYKVIEIREIK